MKQQVPKSIKFTIATDVHLGHKQNHPIRKQDSFHAFEQVLNIATQQKVDFLLLGGDLFDEVNPSQKSIYKCLDLLQQYVQGQGKGTLRARHTQNPDYKINFENQNMHIKLPIFTIHGNHDYPSNDFGKLSICDLLHVSNYANYFGKHTDLGQIVIKPMIIEKQGVGMKIAIYGLGYIKDTVLNELFENKKVRFEEVQNKDQYFCLFIFHQNRYKKGLKAGAPALKCINVKHIPTWMDLTIWGHQHEAINKIQIEDDRKIFQPGSTVITSFIQAESYTKQCLMIEIFDKGEIDLTPIALQKSYRPMVCKNLEIAELQKKHKQQSSEEFDFFTHLDHELNKIIEDSEKQYPGRKPIIRIKVEHSGYEISRWRILELKYSQKVANPQNIMTFWKRKQQKTNEKQIMEAFISKASLDGYDQKQISEEILHIYTKKQQNRHLYFDPREMYKYHQNSVSKDLINARDYLGNFMNKDIEKRRKPMEKQLEMIFKAVQKDVDEPARKIAKELESVFSLDTKFQASAINLQDNQLFDINVNELWEQQRKMLVLKEDQITKVNLTQNYGENFFLQNHQIKTDSQNMNSQEKRQTISGKKQKQPFNIPKNTSFSSINDISSAFGGFGKPIKTQKMQVEQQKPGKRQGILKKSGNYVQISSHDQEQEDCCKRAEKTPYDEIGVKQNFEGANKMVKENVTKAVKKEVKRENKKEPKKQQKNGKSVRWSDSELEEW